MFALAASEDFWGLITSVLIQHIDWDPRQKLDPRSGVGGGDEKLNGAEAAALCTTLRCHTIVLEVDQEEDGVTGDGVFVVGSL